jgi:hypothetical protein
MNMEFTESSAPTSPLSRLQRFARPKAPQERCELCGATIGAKHDHLLELNTRQLHCSCEACAILFSGDRNEKQRYRRVPRRLLRLSEVDPSDALWESLSIPINLAFFYRIGDSGKVLAMYPSPAGATESLLPIDAWKDLTATCETLRHMQSDVEALIINHIGKRRDCFLVPIDECYRLVGLIRSQWRGLSGGQEVWKAISDFFDELHRRASAAGGVIHA